jgi:hypothetical protein
VAPRIAQPLLAGYLEPRNHASLCCGCALLRRSAPRHHPVPVPITLAPASTLRRCGRAPLLICRLPMPEIARVVGTELWMSSSFGNKKQAISVCDSRFAFALPEGKPPGRPTTLNRRCAPPPPRPSSCIASPWLPDMPSRAGRREWSPKQATNLNLLYNYTTNVRLHRKLYTMTMIRICVESPVAVSSAAVVARGVASTF